MFSVRFSLYFVKYILADVVTVQVFRIRICEFSGSGYMSFQDPNMMWDFFSLRPETTHQVMILFGDRGIPDGFRHMDGFGSHTFKLVNKDGNAVYCKFHIKVRFNFFVIFRWKFFFLNKCSLEIFFCFFLSGYHVLFCSNRIENCRRTINKFLLADVMFVMCWGHNCKQFPFRSVVTLHFLNAMVIWELICI